MIIYVVNESTLLDDPAAALIAQALDYQLRVDFAATGWRTDMRCAYLSGGAAAKVPRGGAVLHLLDASDQPGALGYHDEAGHEVPFGRVFVKTTQDDGQIPSETCSHEALELAADPHVNLTALTGDSRRLYAVEVGDPVQGTGYQLPAGAGPAAGVRVANFATPSYFDPRTKALRVDFRGVLKAPFTIAPQGYMSFIDMAHFAKGWQQQVGAERTAPVPPDLDDRVARR